MIDPLNNQEGARRLVMMMMTRHGCHCYSRKRLKNQSQEV
jgi:hypothetical protein